MIENFNGSWFLMIEEFDGSFLIRAFLIERECVYLVKLKHITGFSKLFEDAEYNKAWETKNQIRLKVKHKKENNG